jgi:uncharacterized membrane protein
MKKRMKKMQQILLLALLGVFPGIALAQMMENHGMMMSGWMMFVCAALVILLFVLIVLAILALLKYLFGRK